MYRVTFTFEGSEDIHIFAAFGENLLEVARKTNVAIDAPCSGNASCGKCRVKLLEGDLNSRKTHHITGEEYKEGWRLACTSYICGDIKVLIPDIASAYRSRMKVASLDSDAELKIFHKTKIQLEEAGMKFENDFEIVHVGMNPPSLDDTMPDNERFARGLRIKTGVEKIKIPYFVLKKLPEVLRKSNFSMQAVIRKMESDILVYDIYPKDDNIVVAGLAIDIGTTTVLALVINMLDGSILAKGSAGNGQIRYGADVINRIIESVKPGGKEKLQVSIVEETLNPLISSMCRRAGIDSDQIYQICIASNTTMNHLLLGIHADPIRMEPYIPAFFKTDALFASNIGIAVNPEANITLAPNIGSYVGGDITAGALVSLMWNQPEFSLFIDLGTNGEIIFGNSDFLMSCACSAGPAFEGGEISCGMRAADGAIEACIIDEKTMEPERKVIGDSDTKPIGLCGSGIIDVISELFRCGIIDSKGKFRKEGKRIRYDQYGMGSYILAFEAEADSAKDIEITEVDIDNFIRAKGAIFSAIRTMLAYCDFDISAIEHVYVAGGIGSGINIEHAIHIGMFPNLPVECYQYIGNSSLSGAYTMLYSAQAESKVYEIASNMTYIELSTIPQYMDEFVGACFLPHTDAALFSNE